MCQYRPLFLLFSSFLIPITKTVSIYVNFKKSRWCAWDSNPGYRMVGVDETTELWRSPLSYQGFSSITVWQVSSLTRLDSTASLLRNNNIFSSLVISNLVNLETHCTVILPLAMSVLWPESRSSLVKGVTCFPHTLLPHSTSQETILQLSFSLS